MTLTADLRKFALTLHVTVSVAWAGAVASFLALAIFGLASLDIEHVRAAYAAMDLTYRSVIIPLGLASLVSGVVSSLGTEWRLFRHYWVLIKLLLTVFAVILMLIHVQQVGQMAGAAAATALSSAKLTGLRLQLIAYAGAALLVLLVATVLSTYKPRGRTPYGARKR